MSVFFERHVRPLVCSRLLLMIVAFASTMTRMHYRTGLNIWAIRPCQWCPVGDGAAIARIVAGKKVPALDMLVFNKHEVKRAFPRSHLFVHL